MALHRRPFYRDRPVGEAHPTLGYDPRVVTTLSSVRQRKTREGTVYDVSVRGEDGRMHHLTTVKDPNEARRLMNEALVARADQAP